MSLCIRTIPSKLTSFVSPRNKVRKIECQHSQNVLSSAFLEEFLGKTVASNWKNKMSRPNTVSCIYHNISRAAVNNKYKNGSRAPYVRNFLQKDNDVYTCFGQYNLTHSEGHNINEVQSTECLTNATARSGVDTPYKQNILRNNNYNDRYVIKSLQNNNNDSISNLQSSPNRMESIHKEQNHLLLEASSNALPTTSTEEKRKEKPKVFKATPTQVKKVFDTLRVDLPQFFYRTMDYRIYSPDVEFINNIKGTRTVGILSYIKQMAFVKLYANVRYFQVVMEVIKMTQHPDEGLVKVRWRIRGMLYFKTMFKFTKNKVLQKSDTWRDHEVWYDGFSTFYINQEGLITKHIADKVMPDETYEQAVKRVPISSKLALLMGIVSLDNFSRKQDPLK